MDDAEKYILGLVEKSQNQDPDSFSKLYDELLDPVYRFCYFRLPTQDLAEDITSEVFITAWEKIHTYSPNSNIKFVSWVFRIAQNKIIDFFRANKHVLELKEEILVEDLNAQHLKKEIDNEFLKKELMSALKKIPETQSQSLILKYFSELENKEIAEVMNKSETAVRILQSRGLKALKEYIPQFE